MSLMNEKPKSISTKKGQVYIDKHGILIQTYIKNTDLTLEDAQADFDSYSGLCKECKLPVLIDMENVRSVEREARAFYSSEEAKNYITAAALLITNPVNRIIGNFYMGLNKTAFPFRLFTEKEKTIQWLKKHLSAKQKNGTKGSTN